MTMFPVPDSFFPDLVDILPLSEGKDGDAAPFDTFPVPPVPDPDAVPPVGPTRCRIQLILTRPGYAGESETGVTMAEVAFQADPAINKGGRIVRISDGLVVRAFGPAKRRGSNVLYVVSGEVVH